MENQIIISEGSFGVSETINITSSLIQTDDILTIKIKENLESETLVTKPYTVSKTGDKCTILFSLTEEETAKLPAGKYIWGIEHTRGTSLNQDLPLEDNFYANFVVKKGV